MAFAFQNIQMKIWGCHIKKKLKGNYALTWTGMIHQVHTVWSKNLKLKKCSSCSHRGLFIARTVSQADATLDPSNGDKLKGKDQRDNLHFTELCPWRVDVQTYVWVFDVSWGVEYTKWVQVRDRTVGGENQFLTKCKFKCDLLRLLVLT